MRQSFLEKLKWAFIFWLARRLPDCKTLTPVIGESIDRKLGIKDRVNVKLHLITCDACRNYLKQIKFLRKAIKVRELIFVNGQDVLRSKLSDEAQARIKNDIKASCESPN